MYYISEDDLEWIQSRLHNTRPDAPNLKVLIGKVITLACWTNDNSDGWPYWKKPLQAAQRALVLIEQANTARFATDITDADLTAALRPIRAFCTRQGVRGLV